MRVKCRDCRYCKRIDSGVMYCGKEVTITSHACNYPAAGEYIVVDADCLKECELFEERDI